MNPCLAAQDPCAANTLFHVGAAMHDITGPAAEEGMMGYGMIQQQTAGILQRLWARAFVVESPCNGKRIAFVNVDLGQVFQGIKQYVVRKLQKKYGDIYTDQNVLITATHEHSGPGGYSTYTFYNLTTLGFNRPHFETIVNGIVAAIIDAQNNQVPATIKIAHGSLTGINFNRSPQAYLQNPIEERNHYRRNTDTEMTLLRFDRIQGEPIGIINWFPVHGVSMNNKNHLINGDNKGYAEYQFEKTFNSNNTQSHFVAAFAQANAGDVSPNPYGHEGGNGAQGLMAIEKAGLPQYEKAKELFANATELVSGGIDYRHTFVTMDSVTINPTSLLENAATTCPAAIGVSMLAGTQDGEGVGKQGITCDHLNQLFQQAICKLATTPCQGVKPIAIETGKMKPYPWTPQILPFQIFKIGNIILAAAPFELTTMTGRRIREAIAREFASSKNNYVLLSTLANAYAGYVATNEEYQLQRYEGASTHFGPWTERAIRQQYTLLAHALAAGLTIPEGPLPPDLLSTQTEIQPGVLFDDKPLGKNFGDVYQDVKSSYKPGEVVRVTFWGGHPKNNYRIEDTFLAVQVFKNNFWKTIRKDNDWDTEYHWQRQGSAYSLITIVWRIPDHITKGHYRIVHFGDWKSGWSKKIYPYVGYSSVFRIEG